MVKGRLVVFTRPNGTLASLRLNEVDLDGSRPGPRPKAKVPGGSIDEEPAPERARESRENGTPGLPETLPLEEEDTEILPVTLPDSLPLPTQVAGETPHLLVQSWEKILGEEGEDVEIRGSLHNTGETVASQVTLTITVLAGANRILGRQRAALSQPSVSPGSTVSFSARFPDLGSFEALRFQVDSQRLEFDPRP